MTRPSLIRRLTAALLLALFAAPVLAQGPMISAVERGELAVVHVAVLFRAGRGPQAGTVRVQRSSSGVLVDPEGVVLTDLHLVAEVVPADQDEYWVEVFLADGRSKRARVAARDERLDLALLRLELDAGERVPALDLAAGPPPPAGTRAVALAVPQGAQRFAFSGVVCAPRGPIALGQHQIAPEEALIFDSALLRDADGGPLVDASGAVLALVNTSQVLQHDASTDEEELVDQTDFAFAVAAEAIRGAFPEAFAALDPAPPSAEPEPVVEVARAVAGAVVGVWAGEADAWPTHAEPADPLGERPPEGLGSGVVVDPSGLVLTSASIVGDNEAVQVRLPDGARVSAEVVASGLAGGSLLKLALPEGTALAAATLGNSAAVLPGEDVAVVANPFGGAPLVSAGVLAAREDDGRLRVGAWVHPGHVGGAVVDALGRVIGIAATDIHEGQGDARGESYLGLALAVDRLRSAYAEQLSAAGGDAALTPAEDDEATLERRRSTIARLVERTRATMLNVEVKAEEERSAAFDPFATPGELKLLGQGSGVVIDPTGLAITNWHVVDAALDDDGAQRSDRAVEVTLPDGRRFTARVLSTSRDDDLGLLQLELPAGEEVQPVELGSSRALRVGEEVVAIGNPFGKANTITAGIVAAKNQDAKIAGRLRPYHGMLQTDAAINPGNSGGALLDLEGRLVGINSAGRAGAGLAIPVERVREVFGAKLLSAQALGSVHLGLEVEAGDDGGVLVTGVEADGPGDRGGLRAGDRLEAIGGRALEGAIDYARALLEASAWTPLAVQVRRDDETLELHPVPIPHAAWRVFRQTGLELEAVDYGAEREAVREAWRTLHRSWTGDETALPRVLPGGALQVVRAHPFEEHLLDVRAGDWLLGATSVQRRVDLESEELIRFATVEELLEHTSPLATKAGSDCVCWLLRDGAVISTTVHVRRPPRG